MPAGLGRRDEPAAAGGGRWRRSAWWSEEDCPYRGEEEGEKEGLGGGGEGVEVSTTAPEFYGTNIPLSREFITGRLSTILSTPVKPRFQSSIARREGHSRCVDLTNIWTRRDDRRTDRVDLSCLPCSIIILQMIFSVIGSVTSL